jgi:L-seryl-tRNA(Ser) seleniumtransferase
VDRLLQDPACASLLAAHPRAAVVGAVRHVLAERRAGPNGAASAQALAVEAEAYLQRASRPAPRPVVNATGVILHTNLGRAPLSAAAREAIDAVNSGYSSLEYDLDSGARGSRHEHLTGLLRELTGAEAALAVNNNAAAVLLALATLAPGREVIISRGQLVEIGGGFRIPDVLRQSGAHLIEVGTTNRTYLTDYEEAVGPETALLLRVHASNFRVSGFVHTTELSELAALAHRRDLLLVDDLGSGSLLATEPYGLAHEPLVQESVADGADLICFSGDKLLGGPQAGILVGRADVIGRLRRHPLTRALRPDKGTIAGLHATLQHYLRGEATSQIPVWRMLAATVPELDQRAQAIASAIGRTGIGVEPAQSTVGGGSLPDQTLPSRAVAIRPLQRPAQEVAVALRRLDPPVVGVIRDEHVLLDLRTVFPEQDHNLVAAVRAVDG